MYRIIFTQSINSFQSYSTLMSYKTQHWLIWFYNLYLTVNNLPYCFDINTIWEIFQLLFLRTVVINCCWVTVRSVLSNVVKIHSIWKNSIEKYFISCAFAGYLDILSRQKSALWAIKDTVWAKQVCPWWLMLLADFWRLRIS